jgi:hypothetical protein
VAVGFDSKRQDPERGKPEFDRGMQTREWGIEIEAGPD